MYNISFDGPRATLPSACVLFVSLPAEMWAMAFPLLCSELRPIIQRCVEVIFHQETKGAVPPNHAVPLYISNDGLQRQIDEDGRVEAVYRHFKLNRFLWAAERLFSLEETLYKPQRCFRNLYSSNFHQTACLWRIVTARKSQGFDRMDEWKWALAAVKLRIFPVFFHTSLMVQVASSLIRSAQSTRNLTLWGMWRRCCIVPSKVLELSPYSQSVREQSCTVTQQETPWLFSDQLCSWNHRFRLIWGAESFLLHANLQCPYRHHHKCQSHTVYTLYADTLASRGGKPITPGGGSLIRVKPPQELIWNKFHNMMTCTHQLGRKLEKVTLYRWDGKILKCLTGTINPADFHWAHTWTRGGVH